MSILGTKSDNKNQDKLSFCPAILNPGEEISLVKAIFLSAFLHVAVTFAFIVITAVVMFILQILGLDLSLFQKPEMKVKDIEFVLVNQEAKPKNPNTRFRADRNSRAGGINDPKKRVATPSIPTKKSTPQQKAAAKPTPKPKQPTQAKQPAKKSVKKAAATAKPNTAPPRPAPKISMPKPSLPSIFSTPIPKNNLPKTVSGGGGSSGQKAAKPSTGGVSGAPRPVMSPGSGTAGKGKVSSPYSAGSGSLGNPQGGGGAPGIDAIAEPDFGPWMRELQSKIKRNWDPPKSDQSKRVVLVFTVAKDGRLIRVRVARSSGIPSADQAAKAAVEYSAPFKPLPREFRGSDIDINFTFDYNVFGGNIR